MIYQYAVPKALPQYGDRWVHGHVRYPASHIMTPPSAVNPEFVANLGALIWRLADDAPARRVPSAQECRFCDISKADCSDLIESEEIPEGSTSDF